MLVIRARICKMHVRIAKREDLDQTASSDLGLSCLSRSFFSQLVFEILAHVHLLYLVFECKIAKFS